MVLVCSSLAAGPASWTTPHRSMLSVLKLDTNHFHNQGFHNLLVESSYSHYKTLWVLTPMVSSHWVANAKIIRDGQVG